MRNINPLEIITKETRKARREMTESMENIVKDHPYGIAPIINMKPEEQKDYGVMTSEEIYKELARLNLKSTDAFALINREYLKSAIEKYNQIIPFIESQEVAELAGEFKKMSEDSLKRLEEVLSELKNS